MSENEGRGENLRIDEALRQRLEGYIPEVLKRTIYAGLGAVFTTEDGIRRLTNEFSLPKDVASFLMQQAQTTKNEMFRIIATEVRKFLENMNLNEELQRLLTSLSFEIKTEIRFVPNEQHLVRPTLKNKVTVKHTREEAQVEEPEEDPPVISDEEQS